ncbi:MAG: PadR family transcriptional regulator [Mycobacteriales bacterium]
MNATAASLLGLIGQCGELTGADLVRVAQQRVGDFWSLSRSQVYRELVALAADGLVTSGPTGPRESRPYRLTERGRAAFGDWLSQELPAETIRIPLLLAVAFGASLPPGRLARLLDEAEERHRARLAQYRATDEQLRASGVDPHTRATLSFGVHYEEAVLRWFADLPPAVRRRDHGRPASRPPHRR